MSRPPARRPTSRCGCRCISWGARKRSPISKRRYRGRVAITALHGLRGVGKTVLAAAYAELHRRDYRATWWLRAETEAGMRADLVGLGARHGRAGRDPPVAKGNRRRLPDRPYRPRQRAQGGRGFVGGVGRVALGA